MRNWDELCTWPSGQHKIGQNGTNCARCGAAKPMSVLSHSPRMFIHRCICGVSVGASEMLLSAHAAKNVPCLTCVSGESDIEDDYDMSAHIAWEQDNDTYYPHKLA